MVDTPLGPNSAALTPPGAVSVPNDRNVHAMRGAIGPAAVADAAIAAVESGRVHAVVGSGAAPAARQRVDPPRADLA